MTEVQGIPQTAPILILNARREHLLKWLKDGGAQIKELEAQIVATKQQAIDMASELEQIELALNTLIKAQDAVSERSGDD